MSDRILYQHDDITITTNRFMVGSKTYSVRNIVTTKGLEHDPSLLRRWLFGEHHKFEVVLQTAAGDISAYESQNPDIITDVINALDEAIASQN